MGVRNQQGGGSLEYGLTIALMASFLIAGATILGNSLNMFFLRLAAQLFSILS